MPQGQKSEAAVMRAEYVCYLKPTDRLTESCSRCKHMRLPDYGRNPICKLHRILVHKMGICSYYKESR